jgi:Flp pilus assembly protein TadD
VLADLRRPAEAVESYGRAIALRPDYAEAFNNLGAALRDLRRPAQALASCGRAIALKPDYAEAFNTRGNALTDLNRPEEALASYDEAIALKPDHAVAHDNRGLVLTELGRLEEAGEAIERSIALAPGRIRTYYNLTEIRRLPPGDPHRGAMEELARDMSSLAVDEQIELSFALGKAFADIGDREGSFRRLLDGNALKRRRTPYDEEASLGLFERTRSAFAGELMAKNRGLGEPSPVPVFILGMPRSGTTLVEQILASHSKVFSAGEIDDFDRAATALLRRVGGGAPHYPEAISLMKGEQWRELGADYLARIGGGKPGVERITNKTPENFRLAGLIHLALPNARIVHMRRDPVDTCLSCFSKLFVGDQPYAYDLGELGRYYRGYDALMAHWRAILPPGVMLEVRYEAVVADLEGETRRILAHCGLEWDARCLDFHRTQRPVRTASATQVRQPLYNSAVGRWRAYEPFLGPLLAELAPLIASDGLARD